MKINIYPQEFHKPHADRIWRPRGTRYAILSNIK